MEYTQQDARSTTQEITTNTSDLILFIIMVVLIQNGADLEYI
jgi:low affinity Fe/Cu permease